MEVQAFINRTPIAKLFRYYLNFSSQNFGRTGIETIKEKIKASNLPETRFGACAMLCGRA